MTDTTDAETTASPAGAFTLPGGTDEARTPPAAAADAETLPAGTVPVSASVAPGAHTLPVKTGRDTRPSGIGKHYWTIPRLPVPSGASPALKSFIAMAEAALQTAVDLLGRGTTFPPPRVDDLLTTKVYKSLGEGKASELYQKTLEAVESRQASLLTMDDKVLDVANVMSADKDRTLAAIKHLIADLVAALSRKTAAKLQPADEVSLMDTIAKTIEEVYKRVSKVAEDNLRMSGGGNGGNPGGGNGGNGGNPGGGGSGGQQQQPGANGGGGGGDSGGSGIMQALMMIPMLGASLLPSALQLVEKMNDKSDQRDDRQHPDGPPPGAPGGPPPGAAAPNSPGVPPPGATAPGAPGVPQPGPGGDPAAAAQPAGATIPVSGTDSPPGAPPPPPPPPPPPRTGSA
ncbi:hypothetical protein OHB26_23390 [Nocardia sp. NBC_01503]|uniref:hypothetical protein n=1 Tax=Nocardia sp. NBC_01503 TaxID=2975997 RepID=UPI002E7B15D4|nr:hypothetical protein [Nocardia sp. NBC_01503]WTL29902.1 hypothetical protein OHB26_23390 [Nocardia sp. NBC_01503]